jgi:BirA family biotin operon repressor/biotin-[acetyl-CoA-carboxylase] ligase
MKPVPPPDATDPIDPASLLDRGGLAAFEHHAEVGSTMERARELALEPGGALPVAVVADLQSLGRGQRGARWWQPAGSLAVSVVVDSALMPGAAPSPVWSLACGVALAEAVAAAEPAVEPLVRWPNDVEVHGRKIAGILVETAPAGRAIFGVGVNTTGSAAQAPAPLRQRIATFPDVTGRPLARETLLVEFVPRLARLLVEIANDPAALVNRYRPCCALAGRNVTVFQGFDVGGHGRRITGRCLGIDSDGAIVLETVAGRLHLASGSLTDPADVWRGADGG